MFLSRSKGLNRTTRRTPEAPDEKSDCKMNVRSLQEIEDERVNVQELRLRCKGAEEKRKKGGATRRITKMR